LRQLRREELILPVVALLVLIVDQISKAWIVEHMQLGQSMDLVSWLAPLFQLTYVTNTGVVFGLLPGLGNIFIIVTIVVVAALLLYHSQLPRGQWLARLALGLQVGGALSNNLIDRLARGSVVDFLDLNFWPFQSWAIFNLADTSIVGGAILLGITVLFQHENEQEAEDVRESEEPHPEKGLS
jgi:signal peptidase II